MKKLLFLLAFTTYCGLNGQVLSFDDHSNLTIGNIGTDITGIIPGQDGYLTYSSTTTPVTSNSNFQIVDKGGVYGNAIQIMGSANSQGSRVLNKTNLQTLWSTRNVGNDIIEVEFDLYLGPTTTSRNSVKMLLYTDEATPRILAGIGYNRILSIRSGTVPAVTVTNYTDVLVGYSFNNSTPESSRIYFNASFNSPTPQSVISNDSWIKLGFSYNKLTGQTRWKGAGIDGVTNSNASSIALNLVPGKLVMKVDTNNFGQITDGGTPPVVLFPAISNAASATFAFDSIKISATSTDNLLSINTSALSNESFIIFPNPASDFVSIKSSNNPISKIEIMDYSGRTIKNIIIEELTNLDLYLTDLPSGVYLLKVISNKGFETKKLIKN